MDIKRVIPEQLKPLLTRLKNPQANDDESLEALLHKELAATAIKLIEQGIGEGLVRKFKKDGEINQELLEEFVIRAAMIIPTPTKEERMIHWVEYINKRFGDIIYNDLIEIRKICRYVNKDDKITKQMIKVQNELIKLRDIYLSELKLPKKPNTIDMLINLFLQCLPGIEETFIDTHIRKMVNPFGINLKKDAVRVRKFRSKDKWFTWKGNYFNRQED